MKYFSQIPKTVADLSVLGEEMNDGLTKLAQSLDIKQLTAAQMKAATDDLVIVDDAFNLSRSQQQTAYVNFHAADDALAAWLNKVTGVLAASFGKRWNRQWVQVGFITPSIRVPSTISDRLALALRAINFFTANPGYEAPNQGVTAALGATLRKSATDTQLLATASDSEVSDKLAARDGTVVTLTSLMRLLIGVLGELLNADDTRWLAFGLELPGKLATPAAPTGLTVTLSPLENADRGAAPGTVTVLLTCDPTVFATRYRFRMRIADLLGTTFQLVASTTEPMAQVEIPVNATVEFIAQAVNANRQSVASEVSVYQPMAKRATAPAPAAADAVVKTLPAETPAASNGSNGHGNGSRLPALS